MQTLCSPTPETCGYLRLDTISQSYDHIEVVMVYITPYLTIAFLTN